LRHERRARYAERSITVLYAAIVVFVATCLSIAIDRATSESLDWLPITLAILGTVLLLIGGAFMVTESRLSGNQISDEIHQALAHVESGG
jgi:protein-S-isoprenylcysteine O-methyltransferase Ste14